MASRAVVPEGSSLAMWSVQGRLPSKDVLLPGHSCWPPPTNHRVCPSKSFVRRRGPSPSLVPKRAMFTRRVVLTLGCRAFCILFPLCVCFSICLY